MHYKRPVNESFVRWQQLTMAQFGQMNNLLITLGVGLLAYFTNLLIDRKIEQATAKVFLEAALAMLLMSIALGCACGVSRLLYARTATQLAKRQTKGTYANAVGQAQWSRGLFAVEIALFALGAVSGIVAVWLELH